LFLIEALLRREDSSRFHHRRQQSMAREIRRWEQKRQEAKQLVKSLSLFFFSLPKHHIFFQEQARAARTQQVLQQRSRRETVLSELAQKCQTPRTQKDSPSSKHQGFRFNNREESKRSSQSFVSSKERPEESQTQRRGGEESKRGSQSILGRMEDFDRDSKRDSIETLPLPSQTL